MFEHYKTVMVTKKYAIERKVSTIVTDCHQLRLSSSHWYRYNSKVAEVTRSCHAKQ